MRVRFRLSVALINTPLREMLVPQVGTRASNDKCPLSHRVTVPEAKYPRCNTRHDIALPAYVLASPKYVSREITGAYYYCYVAIPLSS